MAFVTKNKVQRIPGSSVNQGDQVVDSYIKVTRAAAVLPQTTTRQIFRVIGGRVLVKALVGTATTVFEGTDPVLKVSSKQLSDASVAVGTAVDIASTVDSSSLEVGGTLFVEGDGTALVKANAGATFIGPNTGLWIAPQGEIYVTAGASKTGGLKWDIWYLPLDAGAYVAPVDVATAAI